MIKSSILDLTNEEKELLIKGCRFLIYTSGFGKVNKEPKDCVLSIENFQKIENLIKEIKEKLVEAQAISTFPEVIHGFLLFALHMENIRQIISPSTKSARNV